MDCGCVWFVRLFIASSIGPTLNGFGRIRGLQFGRPWIMLAPLECFWLLGRDWPELLLWWLYTFVFLNL